MSPRRELTLVIPETRRDGEGDNFEEFRRSSLKVSIILLDEVRSLFLDCGNLRASRRGVASDQSRQLS